MTYRTVKHVAVHVTSIVLDLDLHLGSVPFCRGVIRGSSSLAHLPLIPLDLVIKSSWMSRSLCPALLGTPRASFLHTRFSVRRPPQLFNHLRRLRCRILHLTSDLLEPMLPNPIIYHFQTDVPCFLSPTTPTFPESIASSLPFLMANLYNHRLPLVSHNLREFSNRATDLFVHNESADQFVRFVLTGEFVGDDGKPNQAFVDAVQNVVEDDHPLKISRDYDSLLGIAPKIMVDSDISVFAVPHNSFALKKSIHLEHKITYQGVSPSQGRFTTHTEYFGCSNSTTSPITAFPTSSLVSSEGGINSTFSSPDSGLPAENASPIICPMGSALYGTNTVSAQRLSPSSVTPSRLNGLQRTKQSGSELSRPTAVFRWAPKSFQGKLSPISRT